MTTSTLTATVSINGTELAYALVRDEHDRRQRAGMGALKRPDDLTVLLALPADEPIHWPALSSQERRRLRRLPAGVVDLTTGGQVIRRAVRPLRLDLAIVPAPSFKLGLERAGRWAPFCARATRLPRPPRRAGSLAEADFYGVGVLVESEWLVEPEPYRAQRATPAAWLRVEQVYASVLTTMTETAT